MNGRVVGSSGGVVGSSGGVGEAGTAGVSDGLAKNGLTADRFGVVGGDGAGITAAVAAVVLVVVMCDGETAASIVPVDVLDVVDVLSGAGVCDSGSGGSDLPCMACTSRFVSGDRFSDGSLVCSLAFSLTSVGHASLVFSFSCSLASSIGLSDESMDVLTDGSLMAGGDGLSTGCLFCSPAAAATTAVVESGLVVVAAVGSRGAAVLLW